MSGHPLDQVTSFKVKLGLLVAASVTVASVVAAAGSVAGVPFWLGVPVTVALALGVTQLLAVGMTSPLREMTAAARRMARGDYSGRVSATSRDEVGELARAFNRMTEDLAAVDRQRRELVANVSHELRTPLAALCAVLENLADGVAEPDPAALRAALDQAERLSTLASDLLDLARVDAGRTALATTAVPVLELLERAVAQARVTGRAVGYVVRATPATLTVTADPARLHQLVANLLDNASRHSPAGGTVWVTAVGDPEGWHLEVADDGPGIPAADRDRVFERFGTLTETDGGGGTGLGLAIARWVTDLHGGSIRVVDPEQPGVGAHVRVQLPRDPSRPPVPAGTGAPPASPPAASAASAAPTALGAPATPGAAVVAQPLMDELFGRFWPETAPAGDVRAVIGSLVVGLLAGLVLPFHDLGLGTFAVLVATGSLVLGFSTHRRSPFTLTSTALCVLLAATVVLRDAEWVVVLCLLSGLVVCLSALTHGRTLPGFVLSGISWPLAALRGLPWLGRSLPSGAGVRTTGAVVRTAVWSLLAVLVFGLLFASADAVFAEWADAVVPHLQLDSFVLRAFITVAVTALALATTYVALNPPHVDLAPGPTRPVARRYEWLVPVLIVDAVFLVFLGAQATVVFGGHEYLQRTTGLTYAEYVHQGFGQLTVATALTLLVVWAAARKAPRTTGADRSWLRGSLGVLCVLTLVVVASALHRMRLYQDAYGFTRLRLLVDVFEGWLGLLVLGILISGVLLRAAWLPRAALLSGAALLLGLAVANPDAWIARHNVDRFAATGKVDLGYLRGLSDDAVPVLAELPPAAATCALSDRRAAHDDVLEWNLGRHHAAELLRGSSATPTADCPD